MVALETSNKTALLCLFNGSLVPFSSFSFMGDGSWKGSKKEKLSDNGDGFPIPEICL